MMGGRRRGSRQSLQKLMTRAAASTLPSAGTLVLIDQTFPEEVNVKRVVCGAQSEEGSSSWGWTLVSQTDSLVVGDRDVDAKVVKTGYVSEAVSQFNLDFTTTIRQRRDSHMGLILANFEATAQTINGALLTLYREI